MDYSTMRGNCISIHQQVSEILEVIKVLNIDIKLLVKDADELRTHEETKSWDGMGRYAKELYDNNRMWDQLPRFADMDGRRWSKDDTRKELLDCYSKLGGEDLFKTNG